MSRCQRRQLDTSDVEERVGAYQESVGFVSNQRHECRLFLAAIARLDHVDVRANGMCCCNNISRCSLVTRIEGIDEQAYGTP